MTTEIDFIFLINHHDDWQPHALAFADWLEERGDPRSNGIRWMIENGVHPEPSNDYPGKCMFAYAETFSSRYYPAADWIVDVKIFDLLENVKKKKLAGFNIRGMVYYDSFSSAVLDMAQAAAKWLENAQTLLRS